MNVNKGTGQYIDVALYKAAYGVKESLNPESSLFKYIRERLVSSLPGISPSNT
jgi:formyl-CoA transferase